MAELRETRLNSSNMDTKLTIEQLGQQVKTKYPQYASFSDADVGNKILAKYPEYQSKIATPTPVPGLAGGNPFGGVSDPNNPIQKYAEGVKQDFNSAAASLMGNKAGGGKIETPGQLFSGALDKTAKVTSAVFSPVTRAISPILQPVLEKMGDNVNKDPWVSHLLNQVNDIIDKHPQAAEDAKNLFDTTMNVAGMVSAPAGIKAATTEAGNIVSDAGTAIKNALPEAKPPVLNETAILDKYNRAIKPTVAGKANASQIAEGNTRTVAGLRTIADNKSALSFTDADGNVITGQAPKTVEQLSQAIEQTKSSIFKQYDALAKQAGEKGVTVDLPSIAQELVPVFENKALSIANPKAVTYAKELWTRLKEAGGVDAQTAQDIIKHYNESLKAFYRNPGYETASQASIDALIANKFREALDKGITSATGEAYQALKNKYGSLASMEKDVARRSTVWGRQNKIGFTDNISNIASGAELVKGLATLDPVSLAAGTTIKGIQLYQKYLNNPDVGVAKIFSEIERKSPSAIQNRPGSAVKDIKSGSSQDSTIFSPKSKTGQLIQSAVEKYKEIPNKQGGFVKIGKQIFKEIPEATKKEMIQTIDYLRLGKETIPAMEKQLSSLAQKYNISEDLSSAKIANYFEKLIEETKTR